MTYDDKDFCPTVKDFMDQKFSGRGRIIRTRIALQDFKEKGFEQLVWNKDEQIKILATPRANIFHAG